MSFQPICQFYRRWRANILPYLPSSLTTITLIGMSVTGVLTGAKFIGLLQPLELWVYDRMVQLYPERAPDQRLLIVAFTESDIRQQQRSTPSDRVLADVLTQLEQYQPRAIGLDLHRDVPQEPGHEELLKALESDSVVAITNLGENPETRVAPPQGVPPERVGFNDFVVDPDGVIRRNLLFATADDNVYYSFALRLSLKYLEAKNIQPKPSSLDPMFLQLGQATFIPLRQSDGGYQNIDDRGYQVLLNYRARQVAPKVTMADVLNGTLDPSLVKDKIVLIGATALISKDIFLTPYSEGKQTDTSKMAGVEIHAQLVSQILDAAAGDRPLVWFWSEPIEVLWLLGWALLGGFAAWRIRHPLMLGFSSTGLLMLLGGASLLIFQYQGWVPIVAPAIALLSSSGATTALRAQQAQRQQQMVMTLLGQNTSPEVATALWNNRDRLLQSGKLPGQKLIATMMFVDIKDFSSISEQMPPEALLDWLNEFLSVMTEAIQAHDGIVNKFTGDGLLAVFGVPMPRQDQDEIAQDAYHAVACALAMGDRLQQLNQSWQQRGVVPIQMRVGIFTGPVVVGSLGGKDRLEYGVIGDSVNIAARLESCAKDRQVDVCRILVAHETLNYVQGQFQSESWGPMALKGKQQEIEVYRITGFADPTAGAIANAGDPPKQQDSMSIKALL